MSEYRGKLIAVEGIDGSGKSTQIQLLRRWLESQKLKVFFNQWNSSELVKSATSKAKKKELLTPTTFSLIHATDFADRYDRQLAPMLKAGYIVLCDRYVFTAYVRDTVRGCNSDWVRELYNFAVKPDLTFLFKADLEVSLGRILTGRAELKFFEAGMDMKYAPTREESFRIFQRKMLARYMELKEEFGFTLIDANQSIEEQQSQVRKLVASKLDLDAFALPQ